MSLEERLREIVDISYKLVCQKIVCGSITIPNEASFQMHLGTILLTIGKLYEFHPTDLFKISFERNFDEVNTTKSNGKARCDILLNLTDGKEKVAAAIELKYLPKSKDEAVSDCRFSILQDIENLEHYKIEDCTILYGYAIVYTTNANYAAPTSRSGIKVGDGLHVSGCNSGKYAISLGATYTFHWDEYDGPNHFLKVEV